MAMTIFSTSQISCEMTIIDFQLLQSESYAFKLRDLDWKFHVEKVSGTEGDAINVHLERIIRDGDNAYGSYGCIATINVELKSFYEGVPHHTDFIQPEEYSATNKMWSIKPFIKYDKLMDSKMGYINDNNEIRLQIKVKADEPTKPNENANVHLKIEPTEQPMKVTLNLMFDQISNVLAIISPEFILWDMPMRVQVYKNSIWDDEKFHALSVFLWNCRKNGNKKVKLNAKIKLIAIGPDGNFLTPTDNNNFEQNTGTQEIDEDCTWAGFSSFVRWQTLQKTYMTRSGSICMQIEIQKEEFVAENRVPSPQPGPSCSSASSRLSNGSIIQCMCCFKNIDFCTLCRVSCGHLYCYECVHEDLKLRKICIMCNEELDLSLPAQIILLD
ncbi:uncharacterized protein LOC116347344 [Contarinia nasturtii]|uniref:uncharacterized protein LOC116347344 n=1 Tax=Contarinia nasturtii TaxID=265458 RepID=UPI0012D394CA|nr:uncharacterized protein LOC116347344 [Contarinia nasturtii]